MRYYLGSETEGLVVFKKSEAEHCILPPFSVVIESEEELAELERILNDDEEDLEDYLDYNFVLDETYFHSNNIDNQEGVNYDDYLELVKEGVVYDLEERRFLKPNDLKNFESFWMIYDEFETGCISDPIELVKCVKEFVFKTKEGRYYAQISEGESYHYVNEIDEDQVEGFSPY